MVSFVSKRKLKQSKIFFPGGENKLDRGKREEEKQIGLSQLLTNSHSTANLVYSKIYPYNKYVLFSLYFVRLTVFVSHQIHRKIGEETLCRTAFHEVSETRLLYTYRN